MKRPKPDTTFGPDVPKDAGDRFARLGEWVERYATENFPGEQLAPGEDGLPEDCTPELEAVTRVTAVRVVAANDIGAGAWNVRCLVRLVAQVALDGGETFAEIRPEWEMCLCVNPDEGTVEDHSHGWDGEFLAPPEVH